MPGRVAGGDGAGRSRRRGPRRRAARRPAAAGRGPRRSSRGAGSRPRRRPSRGPWRRGSSTGASLGVEPAGVHRGDRLLVARERERVLVLAADVVLDRDALGVGAHVAVLDRAPQAVEDGRVDRAPRCRADSRTGRPGSRYGAPFIDLHAAGDASSASPARISAAASMIALRPEPQTRLIVVARGGVREAGLERRLARRRLAGAGLEDLAHQDVVDRRRSPGPGRPARRRPGWRRRRARRPGRRPARPRTCRSACARR